MKKVIFSKNAPGVVGPYSQGILDGNFVFVSGQIGVNPTTGELAQTIADQTRQALENMQHILKEAGTDMKHVVKTTVFLTTMENYAPMNEIYATFFPKDAPARAAFAVVGLPKNALVEIECIASLK